MRVLVADPIAPEGVALLRQEHEVDVETLTRDQLLAQGGDYHAIIVRSQTSLDAAVFDAAAPTLRVVARAGVGLDNVDVDAATRHGVIVCNTPRSNSVSAAEHTMGLMLAAARHTSAAHRSLVAGRWERSRWQGVELSGKVLAILGLGRIGSLVAQRAQAFGMHVAAYDPLIGPERARALEVELVDDLDRLLGDADVVTIHLPRTPDTAGLIGAERLGRMKPTALLVNVARGGIVDEAALATALREGAIAAAALDVFAHEPVTDSPLFSLDNVVATPHLGASTVEAQQRAGTRAAEAVRAALAGELVPTAVNVDGGGMEDAVRRFLPLATLLGRLATHLTPDGTVETLSVEYLGGLATHGCEVVGRAVLAGALAAVSDQRVNLVNAALLAEERALHLREVYDTTTSEHTALLRVSAFGRDGRAGRVGGTVSADDRPRLTELWDTPVDLEPTRHVALLRYQDRPGVIGTVGTILGGAGVNIASAHVGRRGPEDDAVMVLSLDEGLPQTLLHTIADATAARTARYAELA